MRLLLCDCISVQANRNPPLPTANKSEVLVKMSTNYTTTIAYLEALKLGGVEVVRRRGLFSRRPWSKQHASLS